MKNLKLSLTLSILSFGLASLAFAEEYKPMKKIHYKAAKVTEREVAEADVDDYYKFETGMKDNDRQIASEAPELEEKKDREPSSYTKKKKHAKKVEFKAPHDKPEAWYHNHKEKHRGEFGKDF